MFVRAFQQCILLIIFVSTSAHVNVNVPKFSVSMEGYGFHRDLNYKLEFQRKIQACDVLIVQTLHQGIYVDTDQLMYLRKRKLINAFVPVHVNVEMPSEKASPLTVYMYGAVADYSFKLPINFRYHSPSAKRSFTSVPLYEPSLYLKCSDGTEWEHHERRTNHTYEFPCPNSTLADVSVCQWTDSEFITDTRRKLLESISIPVGNSNMQWPVTLVTIIVAWGACVCISYAILRRQRIINKKIA